MKTRPNPKRFEIYWVRLDPAKGREIKKTRPCVIVSPDVMNDSMGTLTVVPLTSTVVNWPFRMTITLEGKKSSLACDQLRTITKERLVSKIAVLKAADQAKLASLLQEIFAE